MHKGETLQGLFDRLMVIINKMRALGCEDWDDHKVTRRFLRAYQVKNMGLAQMIRERDDYDEMKPHTLLGKLQQHEMVDQAAIKATEKYPMPSCQMLVVQARECLSKPQMKMRTTIKQS